MRWLAALLVDLHFAPEDLVHVRLVFFPLSSEPGENVGIHAKAHQLFDWPVETPDLDVGSTHPSLRCVSKVDLRISASCEAL